MSKSTKTNPETNRIEVVVSPENYPRTVAALESLKRIIVEEAQDYAKSHDLPDVAAPPMVVALLQLSQRFAQSNIEQMWKLFPDLLSETRFEDIPEPSAPQPQTKFRGH